ncbi:hypothetical protein [Pedobacter antarcticus]|uniref:hypothetical protein n=1 Tax=Pedobacter antarcticus TaxID=34086 RepID=UPI002931A35D|nr:hypothetical protein [Pedobacter antarcticus]
MANQRTDTQSVINLVINGKQAMNSLKELTDTQRKLNTEVSNMKATDPGYDKQLKELQMMNKALKERRKEIRGADEDSKNLALTWKGMASGVLGGNLAERALDAVVDSIKRMKDAFAEAEKNRAILTNALKGDTKMADGALKMLMDFAAKTPEGLQEATSAYLKLVNRGIIPTKEEMINLGDVAASQGKSMDQYVEAILDAQTGENERLKELGIRATKNGDTVTFAFKGVTKEVKNTEDAIYKALLSFGEMEGVAGTMDTVSKTIVGMASNIEDTWDQIFTKLGKRSEGFIAGFYRTYASMLEYLNDDLLSTESNAEKLTNAFKTQGAEVFKLEKNVTPLIDRYDELKKKGALNKTEQIELNRVIKQIGETIPGAITQWNNLGDAMDINTNKAREFIQIQKVLLRTQNKEAVDAAQQEIATYTKVRDAYLKDLRAGETKIVSGGGKIFNIKNSDKEIQEFQAQVRKYNDLIEERRLMIKGLNGDYMDEISKPPVTPTVENKGRTEGVIEKEIKALKEKKAELDVHSKAYAETIAAINKLEDELNRAKGKTTAGDKKLLSDKQKAINEFEKLDKDYEKLEVERLDALVTKNQKEIDIESRKYDELIKLELKAQKLKGVTPEKKKESEEKVVSLQQRKKTAIDGIEVRQEAEMLKEISSLRTNFSRVQATEFQKQRITIQKFYDQLEKDNAGNETRLADLKIARTLDLADVELYEKEQLEKEKQQIEAKYETFAGVKLENKLATINKRYDDEIAALKLKFGKEIELTKEFQDTIDKINSNRKAEISLTEKQVAKENRDYTIDMARSAADATFSIISNSLKAQLAASLSNLESQRNKELEKKNLTEKQKKAINDKYDKLVKQEKLDSWQSEKKAAAGQAVINGALAVTKALPNIPLAIATGVAAAAQLAIIVAEQPPEFGVGVRNFKGGTAIVGEKGPEAINENGKWWIAQSATLTDLEPGTDVYTATDTAAMLSGKNIAERTYVQPSYTVDSTAIRSAERNYRSTGSEYFSSPTTPAPTPSAPNVDSTDLSELKDLVSKLIAAQQAESEKQVVLVYQNFEEYQDNIKRVKLSQTA